MTKKKIIQILTCQTILDDFYVDDLLTGKGTVVELITVKFEIISMLYSYGFELRKWISNDKKLLQGNEDSSLNQIVQESKTLRMIWDSEHDLMGFSIKLRNAITKEWFSCWLHNYLILWV